MGSFNGVHVEPAPRASWAAKFCLQLRITSVAVRRHSSPKQHCSSITPGPLQLSDMTTPLKRHRGGREEPRTFYAVGTGCGMGGCSGFVPFCSEMGVVGRISSLGSTMLTWSGRGFLGPIFPLGSQGSMIFTLMPSTPEESQGHGQERRPGDFRLHCASCSTRPTGLRVRWHFLFSALLSWALSPCKVPKGEGTTAASRGAASDSPSF